MRSHRILLVEDDSGIRRMLRRLLVRQGYSVLEASYGRQGLKMACSLKPELILADWALGGGLQGVNLCARLKKDVKTRSIPIILLTGAKVRFEDELLALNCGADLYLTKDEAVGTPQKLSRFQGYIRSLLSRPFSSSPRNGILRIPGLQIDSQKHTLKLRQEEIIDLSTKQFDLLYLLIKRYPRTVSRKYLVRRIWKNRVRDREVDVAICRLKTRIAKGKQKIIESVVGRGYRLCMDPLQ